ncbi:MAG: PIN domain-containing protein [Bacteroidales bacterium]|nr:PIN domain-containing protein [Bacteroidales bacterium]
MKKIYLDTSVPSAVFDLGKPERLKTTKEWFEKSAAKYILHTSDLTIEEINELLSTDKKNNILNLIKSMNVNILKTTREALELSKIYIEKGAIPVTEPEDALHIAVAVIHQIPYFASWDFKHIVSKNPVRKIEELNKKVGYNSVKIGTVYDFI